MNGKTGHYVPEDKQIIVKFVLIDFLEFVLEVFNAVDGPVYKDFMLRHNA